MEVSSKTFRAPRGFSRGHTASVTEKRDNGGVTREEKTGEMSNAEKERCDEEIWIKMHKKTKKALSVQC